MDIKESDVWEKRDILFDKVVRTGCNEVVKLNSNYKMVGFAGKKGRVRKIEVLDKFGTYYDLFDFISALSKVSKKK